MELRQLEYLVAVVEEGSFTRAAVRVHISQPGVSAQIRQLEEELGEPLLDRSGRGVRLTRVGEAVLPWARAALDAVATARHVVHDFTGLVRGQVTLGTVISCGLPQIPELLAEYHRRYPAVSIALSEADSVQLVERISAGVADMILIGVATQLPAGLTGIVLVDEPLVAAVCLKDAWAGQEKITLEMLGERDLICLPLGTGLRTCLDSAAERVGVRLRVRLEANSPTVLAELAARGLGVAILPQSTAARNTKLRSLAIRPTLRSRMELAWRTDARVTPAAKALIDLARVLFKPHA